MANSNWTDEDAIDEIINYMDKYGVELTGDEPFPVMIKTVLMFYENKVGGLEQKFFQAESRASQAEEKLATVRNAWDILNRRPRG